jgi:hypothetical protein
MALKDHSETRLHIAVVQYLNGEIRSGKNIIRVQRPFDIMFFHPSNEVTSKDDAYWNKVKGIMPGIADLMFLWGDYIQGGLCCYVAAIELKTHTGLLSPHQKNFSVKFQGIGGKYAVCRTVAAVRDTLKSWGLVCKNEQVIEPKPAQEELQANYMELMKPHRNSTL